MPVAQRGMPAGPGAKTCRVAAAAVLNAADQGAKRAHSEPRRMCFPLQAWAALAVGGLLSFNLIFPSDQPDIARLIG